ncbi:MAG: Gp37 family protein [Pseudomonadota bacterium]
MNIEILETAIVNRLKTAITDVKVEAIPDDPQNYKLLHPKGAILVHYSGSKFKAPDLVDYIAQDRYVTFDVFLSIRGLRNNNGAYNYLETTKSLLTGFSTDDIGKMYPIDESFQGQDNGLWHYYIRIQGKTKHEERL